MEGAIADIAKGAQDMKRLAIGLVACAILFSNVGLTFAQVRITGAISGTVTDASDSAVPGATVQLKDEGTAASRDTVTNDSVLFSFPDLNHGSNQITFTLQGCLLYT
jgi:hypothetical protein